MSHEVTKPLFVVGIQKSGTTLFVRLLQQSGLAASLSGRSEGGVLWGNKPSFSPVDFPAGAIYQRTNGERGHEAGAEDIAVGMREAIERRFVPIPEGCVGFSKDPFNTVRLPWIRGLFPESVIVAVIRRPAPNVFSLLKKFIPPYGESKPPEDGWWGVKPRRWRELRDADTVAQIARQWHAVNSCLWENRSLVDMVVWYDQLCEEPVLHARRALTMAAGRDIPAWNADPISCFDGEFQRGSVLRSKNLCYKERGNLSCPEDEGSEVGPLNAEQVEKIESVCGELSDRMRREAVATNAEPRRWDGDA
jgi:hypothetical protein